MAAARLPSDSWSAIWLTTHAPRWSTVLVVEFSSGSGCSSSFACGQRVVQAMQQMLSSMQSTTRH